MKQKTAIITGARGQDASYLAEFLLKKGYLVVSTERRSSSPDYSNIKHLFGNSDYILEQSDITDMGSIARIVRQYQPDEFYNLAAQSFVAVSWDQPITTCEINFVGVCNCLESIRLFSPKTRFYHASTSEIYGDVIDNMQDEDTLPRPRSTYAAAKFGAESLIKVYQDSYDLFACIGRLFNHESERRGKQFVTRKITTHIAEMYNACKKYKDEDPGSTIDDNMGLVVDNGDVPPIHLGNLDAKRDWGHSSCYIKAMWLMLQQKEPDIYVIATGEAHSIREFLTVAFEHIGITNWSPFVVIDPKFFRPADVNFLCGNPAKAMKKLGWKPEIGFKDLVIRMLESDINNEQRQ